MSDRQLFYLTFGLPIAWLLFLLSALAYALA